MRGVREVVPLHPDDDGTLVQDELRTSSEAPDVSPGDPNGFAGLEAKVAPGRQSDRPGAVGDEPLVNDPPLRSDGHAFGRDADHPQFDAEPLLRGTELLDRAERDLVGVDPRELGRARRTYPGLPAERDLRPSAELSHLRAHGPKNHAPFDPLARRVPPGEPYGRRPVAEETREQRPAASVRFPRDIASLAGDHTGHEFDGRRSGPKVPKARFDGGGRGRFRGHGRGCTLGHLARS